MVFIVVIGARAHAIARSEAAASARTWPAAKDMIGPDENDGVAHSASRPVWEPPAGLPWRRPLPPGRSPGHHALARASGLTAEDVPWRSEFLR